MITLYRMIAEVEEFGRTDTKTLGFFSLSYCFAMREALIDTLLLMGGYRSEGKHRDDRVVVFTLQPNDKRVTLRIENVDQEMST